MVDTWIGHNEEVAKKNYLQVTEDHYLQFTSKAKQKAKQQVAAPRRTESQTKTTTPENTRELLHAATPCDSVHEAKVGATGLEPVTPCL